MSERKWKPGDVALVKNEWGVWNVAVCAVRATHRAFVWSYGVSDAVSPLSAEARPLVVIDPEDTRQVQRFFSDLGRQNPNAAFGLGFLRLRDALREYATATPSEPGPTVSDGEARAMRDALARIARAEGAS